MPRTSKKTPNLDAAVQMAVSSKAKAPKTSRSNTLIALLKRKHGVSIKEMMQATGWQQHSIRGFMAGALKKKLGLAATSTTTKSGERRYHVA